MYNVSMKVRTLGVCSVEDDEQNPTNGDDSGHQNLLEFDSKNRDSRLPSVVISISISVAYDDDLGPLHEIFL